MGLPLNVLVLEDNPDDAELMLAELKRAGFDVKARCVDSEAEFLRALDERPAIILADFQLPRFDAMAALDLVRKRRIDAPFIIVSGAVSEEVAVECMKRGAADYLLKDRLTRLGPAVRQALEAKHLREEQRRADEARRESEARYRSLSDDVMESSAVGMLIIGKDGKVAWANRAAHRYFGLPADSATGADHRQLLGTKLKGAVEDGPAFERIVLSTYEDNTYHEVFHCHVLPGPGRRERWLEHSSQPINLGLYAGGRIEHYTDITELKSAERSAAKAGRELDERLSEAVEDLLNAAEQTVEASATPGEFAQVFRMRAQALRRLFSVASGHEPGPADMRELAETAAAAITGHSGRMDLEGPTLTISAGAAPGAARALLNVIGEARRAPRGQEPDHRLAFRWERVAAESAPGELILRLCDAGEPAPKGRKVHDVPAPKGTSKGGSAPVQADAKVLAQISIPLSAVP